MKHIAWNRRGEKRSRARSARQSQPPDVPWSMFRVPFQRGVSLVEIIVGAAILLLVFTGMIAAYNVFVRAGLATLNTVQASYLLEEGVEAVSIMRDYGWTANIASLTAGANYYLVWSDGRWIATTMISKIDNVHSRYFTLANVTRDSNDNIASSGAVDIGTRKLTVYVSWQNGATATVRSISAYLTNLFNN